ncbi:uncharacterized protein METZ01_LOCUS233375, partial [marine metagenome]
VHVVELLGCLRDEGHPVRSLVLEQPLYRRRCHLSTGPDQLAGRFQFLQTEMAGQGQGVPPLPGHDDAAFPRDDGAQLPVDDQARARRHLLGVGPSGVVQRLRHVSAAPVHARDSRVTRRGGRDRRRQQVATLLGRDPAACPPGHDHAGDLHLRRQLPELLLASGHDEERASLHAARWTHVLRLDPGPADESIDGGHHYVGGADDRHLRAVAASPGAGHPAGRRQRL